MNTYPAKGYICHVAYSDSAAEDQPATCMLSDLRATLSANNSMLPYFTDQQTVKLLDQTVLHDAQAYVGLHCLHKAHCPGV